MSFFRVFFPIILAFLLVLTEVLGFLFEDRISYFRAVQWASLLPTAFWFWMMRVQMIAFFSRKKRRSELYQVVLSLTFLLLLAGLCSVSMRPRFNLRFDLTNIGQNSLSAASLEVLKTISTRAKEIEVQAYFVDARSRLHFRDLLAMYQAESDIFNVSYYDPNLDVLRAKRYSIGRDHTVIFTIGSKEVRRDTLNEQTLTNALVDLLRDEGGVISFIEGHGETSIESEERDGLLQAANVLRREGYTVSQVNLDAESHLDSKATDIYILCGPVSNLSIMEVRKLRKFIEGGSALLVAVDALQPTDGLNSLLGEFGLEFSADFVVLPKDDKRVEIFGQNSAIVEQVDRNHFLGGKSGVYHPEKLLFRDSRSLVAVRNEFGRVAMFPLVSLKENIAVTGVASEQDLQNTSEHQILAGPFNLVGTVKTSQEADSARGVERHLSLMAVGSSQFMRNHSISSEINRQFLLRGIDYLRKSEGLVSIDRSKAAARRGSLKIETVDGGRLFNACVLFVSIFIFASWDRHRSSKAEIVAGGLLMAWSWKNLLWVLVALLLLAFIARWDEISRREEWVQSQAEQSLLPFPPSELVEFDLELGGDRRSDLFAGQVVKIRREDSIWKISLPIESKADQEVIDRLVENLFRFQFDKRIDGAQRELADYGIEKDKLTLRLWSTVPGRPNMETTLSLGSYAPVGYKMYFYLGGAPDFYIGSRHLELILDKSLYDLRDKSLLGDHQNAIDSIGLRGSGGQQRYESGTELFTAYANKLAEIKAIKFLHGPEYLPLIKKFQSLVYKSALELVSPAGVQTIEFMIDDGNLYAFDESRELVLELPFTSLNALDPLKVFPYRGFSSREE